MPAVLHDFLAHVWNPEMRSNNKCTLVQLFMEADILKAILMPNQDLDGAVSNWGK